jgi:hypothetical protein
LIHRNNAVNNTSMPTGIKQNKVLYTLRLLSS